MNKYELLLVLPGTFDEKEAEKKAEEIVQLVKETGSEVELHEMGKNRLAYAIKQIRYGYFYTITFAAEAAKTRELENKLRLNREILRFLITHFSTNLTAQQKIAYTTDASGITRMVEKNETPDVVHVPQAVVERKEEKREVKKEEALNLEEINKKLDDLMGDVVEGV